MYTIIDFFLAEIDFSEQYCIEGKKFKEYVQFLNRLYDITWFGTVYAY